ncbi:NAD(P)/FAD-dependent oxidoreductase [Salipaludibacillus sp. CUR1]|uniref:phytoene desaturase family protein n=1 Tax=Salipaludibacillus sp. CUR1 TaxID=2820003 RepID=UPI001E590618|nr:FAD-dependent oxidoreductase [Salipaludibacillus sp. CUR1]MCE7793251.1 NAD(P)/FAD-dependent oxidoreductase [Salipaludibacillus sp. CUR1]
MGKGVLIAGSGIAGLTAGALLQKNGYQVTLLEAAAEWGGCAGKFQRKDFTFPVGATLGMGFEPNGLHTKVNDYLGITINAVPLPTVMDVRIGSRTLPYYTERSRFLTMWEKEEPDDSLRIMNFFNEVWRVGKVLRNHMQHYPVLPPESFQEYRALLRGFSLDSITLIPYVNQSLASLVKKHRLQNCMTFIHFINGVLMDSMQTTYKECELLMGCAALDIYHQGAFYVDGGLFRLAEELIKSILENGGTVKKPRSVVSVKKEDKWRVEDHRGHIYETDHVVLNVPLSNLRDLLETEVMSKIHRKIKAKEDPLKQWGTYTVYMALKEDCLPDDVNLFHQFMLDPDGPSSEGNHFFMSISKKGDLLRAPAGYRTITVSAHVHLKEWQTKEAYDYKSMQIKNNVLKKLEELAPGSEHGLVYVLSGGPRAWERFVKRKSGGVGGFPQTKQNALWRAVRHRTGIDGLWLCGDNIFPGAGSIGAASSGVHVARSITGERLV